MNLQGRSLLKETDLSREEFEHLLTLAFQLREEKRMGFEFSRLARRNVALIFEKSSTRTRSAFEVAAHDEGAHVTYLGPGDTHLGIKESVKDTARVLGRLYDGIEYRVAAQKTAETLAEYAGVPVWNGLTDRWHPTQMLADMLTMQDHAPKPLSQVRYCYLGDGRNNVANSLLVTGALLGMDVRICAPEDLWPDAVVQDTAWDLAASSGAHLTVTDSVKIAVADADFLYTDVWVSMGEAPSEWEERVSLLLPYQVNAKTLLATGNDRVKFMHCLPALHDQQTTTGREILSARGLDGLEVTDEVFESAASIVFDQAENRLHTIKAIMTATLAG